MAIREPKNQAQRWRLLIGSVAVGAAALGVSIYELPASTQAATASTPVSTTASTTAPAKASTTTPTAASTLPVTASTDVSTAAPADASTDLPIASTDASTEAPSDLPTASTDPNPSSTVVVECTSGTITNGDVQTSSSFVTKVSAGELPDLPGGCTVQTG